MEYGSRERLKLAGQLLREASKPLVSNPKEDVSIETIDMLVDSIQTALTTIKDVRIDETYAGLIK